MREFSGAEPLVGEIRALRTFRVDESGMLLPQYAHFCWYDGDNRALCTPPNVHGPTERPHQAPDPDCDCGIYAYGSLDAVAQNHDSRYVLAVVSCWGRVIAGTKGVRAEHARIDALWLHPDCPAWLRRIVMAHYPSARFFTNREAMLAEYPPTELECYEPVPPDRLGRLSVVALGAAVLITGLLPAMALEAVPVLYGLWFVMVLGCAGVSLWFLTVERGRAGLDAAEVCATVLLWLLAPLFTTADWTAAVGVLLRVPLGLVIMRWLLEQLTHLRPHYFPVVRPPRMSAFDRLAIS